MAVRTLRESCTRAACFLQACSASCASFISFYIYMRSSNIIRYEETTTQGCHNVGSDRSAALCKNAHSNVRLVEVEELFKRHVKVVDGTH
jgi:hypothetical protein